MQRINLKFILENNLLTKNYNSSIISFLKKSLEDYDKRLFEEYYGNNTELKSFTFSMYLPNSKFTQSNIILSDNYINVSFATSNIKDLLIFYNCLLAMRKKKFSLNSNSMTLQDIKLVPVREITENKIIIMMESPILARIHSRDTNKDKYLKFDDADFEQALVMNIKNRVERMNYNVSMDGFKITPIKAKTTVINHFGMLVNANLGVYLLEGDIKLLQLLHGSGIGSQCNSGHGKYKVLK